MARGKHLSLEEARKKGKPKRFAKEHPSEGDATVFARLNCALALGTTSEEWETLGVPASERFSGPNPRQ